MEVFNDCKELRERFNQLTETLEAQDNNEFVENITRLYKDNISTLQLVLLPQIVFSIEVEEQSIVDFEDNSKHYEILAIVEKPDLDLHTVLTSHLLLFQYSNKQVVLIPKPNAPQAMNIKDYMRFEEYIFQRILMSKLN